MGIHTEHLIVHDGDQIIVEHIIGHQTIDVVFKIKFVLHGLMQYVSDGFSN